jgi:hypothetical protein
MYRSHDISLHRSDHRGQREVSVGTARRCSYSRQSHNSDQPSPSADGTNVFVYLSMLPFSADTYQVGGTALVRQPMSPKRTSPAKRP